MKAEENLKSIEKKFLTRCPRISEAAGALLKLHHKTEDERIRWESILVNSALGRVMSRKPLDESDILGPDVVLVLTKKMGEEKRVEISDYYESRINITKSVFLKAEYYKVLWEVDKQNYELALKSIDFYFECSEHCIQKFLAVLKKETNDIGWDIFKNILYFLKTTANIAFQLANVGKFSRTGEMLWQLISKINDTKNYRYLLELSQIYHLLYKQSVSKNKLTGIVPQQNLEVLDTFLEGACNYYLRNENYHLHRSFEEVRVAGFQLLGKNDKADAARLRIAESWEEEGLKAERNNEFFRASFFYQGALVAYKEIGKGEKVEEMKGRVRAILAQAEKKEMKEVKLAEIEISNKEVERIVDLFVSLPQAELLPTLARRFLPDFEKVKEHAESNPPVFELFATKIYTDAAAGRIKVSKGSIEDHIIRTFILNYKLNGQWFAEVVEKLAKMQKLTPETITDFIQDSPLFTEEDINIVRRGVERYIAGDYISSMSILIPKVESATRKILTIYGREETVLTSEEEGMQPKSLSKVLGELGEIWAKEGQPKILMNIQKYFEILFIDRGGREGLRDRFSHGLLSEREYNKINASLVLHSIILLGGIYVKPQKEVERHE